MSQRPVAASVAAASPGGAPARVRTAPPRDQVGFRHKPFGLPVRDRAAIAQAAAPFLARNMREVRPLRSTGITPLPRYYEPVRLPAAADVQLWIPAHRCLATPRRVSRGPTSSIDTRPPLTPRAVRCVRTLVASASITGFSTFGRLATAIGFTRPNWVRLRWARVFALVACERLARYSRNGPICFTQSVTRLCQTGATW